MVIEDITAALTAAASAARLAMREECAEICQSYADKSLAEEQRCLENEWNQKTIDYHTNQRFMAEMFKNAIRALSAAAPPRPAAEIERLRTLCLEMYQVVGCLALEETAVLDQLSAAGNGSELPHKTLLPFIPKSSPAAGWRGIESARPLPLPPAQSYGEVGDDNWLRRQVEDAKRQFNSWPKWMQDCYAAEIEHMRQASREARAGAQK